VDPELQVYLDEFKEALSVHNLAPHHAIILLSYVDSFPPIEDKPGARQVGVCIGVHVVHVLKGLDKKFERAVTWHELGHCMMDLEHNDNPDSLMFPNVPYEITREIETEFFGEMN